MGEEHETFPNAVEATCLIVVLFALQFAVAAVLLSFERFADVSALDLAGLVSVGANGILFSLLLSYKKLRYRDLFHSARHSVVSTFGVLTIPIVLLVPGLVIVAGAVNSLVTRLVPMSYDEQELFAEMMANDALAILFGCIVAPFLEEMLFRGVILRSFLRQYSRTASILGSAALFSLAHLNVYQLVTAFSVGVVAGWLYERTRSLWPCILLHAAYNAFVIYSYALFSMWQEHATLISAVALGLALLSGMLLLRILMPARVSGGA